MRTALLVAALAVTACNREPEPFDAARIKGNQLLQKNEFAAAGAEYQKSLDLKPDQPVKVWDQAAFAYMKANEFDKAAAVLEKSVDRRADQAAKLDTLRNIGGMYLQTAHDTEKAETYFKKALAIDPKDDQSLSWLAEISSMRGGARGTETEVNTDQLKIAIERYDAVIAAAPNKPDAFINKRIVLLKYIDFLTKQKLSILADAENNKKDKEAYASAQEQATDTQTRIDELKAVLADTSKKLGEVNTAGKK